MDEPFNDLFNPESDSSDVAQKYRSKIYLFIGRSYNWNDSTVGAVVEKYAGVNTVSDFAPPVPVDSIDELSEIYDDMIALKRINRADVSEVIRKRVWQTAVIYDMYRHDYGTVIDGLPLLSATGQSKLYDTSFYVMNSNYQVYKCIYNGQTPEGEAYPNGKPSTVEPTGTSTSIVTYADGYQWKYMYTISISDYIKFVSTDFIPVKADSAVQSAAVDGAINRVMIVDRGSDLDNGTYYTPVLGNDTTEAVVQIVVSGAVISSATMQRAGSGYTYGTIDLTKCYTSESNALNRTNPIGGGGLGTVAKLQPIFSPKGGHGANPIYEFGAYRIMINKSLDFLDGSGDIPVNMQFRRFGLIEDPQTSGNIDFISPTATVCKAIKFPSGTAGNFQNGEIITQTTTGAKGRVIHWDSINKILRYYQNEYISNVQTDPNIYTLVPFTGINNITGATSDVTALPESYNGTPLTGITFTNGYSGGEIKPYSGNILYVENRKPVFRSNDQIEDVKLVIEF